ncbi:MAG: hypothetical protein V1903_01465 [Bacteroidota bacterium]
MDKKRETRSGKSVRKGRRFTRADIAVFVFFLGLSFVFWYLNSLGKDLTTSIRYPLTYANTPGDWKIGEENPRYVSLNLNGPGYSILQMKMTGKHSPLVIDFSRVNYRHSEKRSQGDYFIITSSLVPGFNSQLKSECRVNSIKPDTIFISVD